MTMSRMALMALLLVVAAAPAQATDPITAEQALDNYRQSMRPVNDSRCITPADEDEIVVCGRNIGSEVRLPLPIEREPGEIVRHVGEPTMQSEGCIQRCAQPLKFNILAVPSTVKKIIDHFTDDD